MPGKSGMMTPASNCDPLSLSCRKKGEPDVYLVTLSFKLQDFDQRHDASLGKWSGERADESSLDGRATTISMET